MRLTIEFIKRKISASILEAFRSNPTITLTGPRQAGKSTLLQKLFPKLPYVNLESINIRNLALEDPEGFLDQYKDGAIFDEAQRVPDLFSAIQVVVDKIDKNSMFIISGSQNFLLLEKISQSLAGRTVIFHLPPFSMSELGNRASKDLNEKIYTGGYPRIHDKKLNPDQWLESYIQTFVERDVRTILNVSNLDQFRLFVQMCASRSGQILDLTSLGNDCGITSNTAKAWLSLLETSFIVFRLQPYYKNYNKRLIKSPKLYFWDSGLLCHVLKIKNHSELTAHASRGHVFETYIISEIKKYFLINNSKIDMYYWHDKAHEVDCILEKKLGKLIPIEIKAGKTFSSDYKKSLEYLQKITEHSQTSYILYAGDLAQNLPRKLSVTPENHLFKMLNDVLKS
jgi:uncharacterized protein